MKKLPTLVGFAAGALMLGGCVEDTGSSGPTSGRATLAEVEQSCARTVAERGNWPIDRVSVINSTGSSEGTAVFLEVDGTSWTCRADAFGTITSLQGQG